VPLPATFLPFAAVFVRPPGDLVTSSGYWSVTACGRFGLTGGFCHCSGGIFSWSPAICDVKAWKLLFGFFVPVEERPCGLDFVITNSEQRPGPCRKVNPFRFFNATRIAELRKDSLRKLSSVIRIRCPIGKCVFGKKALMDNVNLRQSHKVIGEIFVAGTGAIPKRTNGHIRA